MPITIESLSYSYIQPSGEKTDALKDVSCSIEDGDFVGIMGHTGCGKTTLVRLIAGLLSPTGGQIRVNGLDIHAKGYNRSILRQTIGVVFQYPEVQLFETTVEKDVAFGLKYSGLSRRDLNGRVEWALETMGFEFEKIRSQSPLALSGGEKRRVSIAGVLATKPKILLFDEPIAGLDPYGRQSFLHFMTRMNQAGTTIVMVSHNLEALCEHTKHLLLLDSGRLIDSGETKEVFVRLHQMNSGAFGRTKSQKIVSLLSDRHMVLPSDIVTYDDLLNALKKKLTGGALA
ncbi:MAG: ATP-binding cassette domain-containing protein [Ruminiclostridium sp.]|nr:ATP-binding cassette domain-containing protein [Ruminiclostridium sp.]